MVARCCTLEGRLSGIILAGSLEPVEVPVVADRLVDRLPALTRSPSGLNRIDDRGDRLGAGGIALVLGAIGEAGRPVLEPDTSSTMSGAVGRPKERAILVPALLGQRLSRC